VSSWTTDVLGDPYEQRTMELPDDDEGPVVATLVRRRATRPTRRAVLYVHGWVDYFFQTHLADFFVGLGYDFYALDMRKHGRSLRDHQTPYYCRSVREYFAELDEAERIIRADGHDVLLLDAHSTGGLVLSLWAHRIRGRGRCQALLLNSPFFDFNLPTPMRLAASSAADVLGTLRPYQVVQVAKASLYGESLHVDHRGEWHYDLAWKPSGGVPVRAGWLRAVHRAHQRLHRGLAVDVPVLVQCGTLSRLPKPGDDTITRADVVLDVEHIARWAVKVGPYVTVARVADGIHDLALSSAVARDRFFADRSRWLTGYLPATAGSGSSREVPHDAAGVGA
jgi:alpha-beta hydrolase superfamily lysophospholipase